MRANDSVTVRELTGLMRSEHPPLLLDVRRSVDREKDPAMLPETAWRDPEKVAEWAGELQGRETVIYCVRGGSVSRSVSDQLRQKGIAVRFLDGGLEARKSADRTDGTKRS